jgi:hypothetical protein
MSYVDERGVVVDSKALAAQMRERIAQTLGLSASGLGSGPEASAEPGPGELRRRANQARARLFVSQQAQRAQAQARQELAAACRSGGIGFKAIQDKLEPEAAEGSRLGFLQAQVYASLYFQPDAQSEERLRQMLGLPQRQYSAGDEELQQLLDSVQTSADRYRDAPPRLSLDFADNLIDSQPAQLVWLDDVKPEQVAAQWSFEKIDD